MLFACACVRVCVRVCACACLVVAFSVALLWGVCALCVCVLLVRVGTPSGLLAAAGFSPPHSDPEGWPPAVWSWRLLT